ncbi:MAG: DUF1275 domain-containing protein [Acidothermales bacterium]|nr:DUF1275 domain-containing protein [Acidothermales bacterium]
MTTGDHRDAGRARARAAERVAMLPVALATVLTVATGAMDAISFLRLGEVFTSIMTGNLVQLGLSVGRHDGQLAARAAFAVVAFVAGVVASSTIVGPAHPEQPGWPARVNIALTCELGALVGFLVGWAATDGRPEGLARTLLIAVAALAMGVQSGAVRAINAPRLSTTYLTGTLIGALATLITAGRVEWHSVTLLAAVVVGALVGGLLVVNATVVAPVLPVGLLVAVLLTATITGHVRGRRRHG